MSVYQLTNKGDIEYHIDMNNKEIIFVQQSTNNIYKDVCINEKDVFDGKIAKNETLILVNTNSITVPGKKGCGSSTALANPLSIAGIVAMTVGVSGFLFFVLPKKDKKDEVM